MNTSRYIVAALILCSVMVLAQPTRAPKLFPKFASLKTAVQPNTKAKALVQPEVAARKAGLVVDTTSEIKAEPVQAEQINWMTFSEALEKQKTEQRKFYLDVYTEWCGWCKKMDASTFSDKDVIKIINEKYYAIKFDAEQKEDIEFNGKTYKFVNEGRRGYHELAQFFLNGRMGYPTSVFLDEKLEVIQPIPGYLDANKLDVILHYFGTNAYENIPWDTFQKQYEKGSK